jgi:HAD superfamily hydrolase (TIGR01490 family)
MVRDVRLRDIAAVTNELGDCVLASGFRPDCIIYLETGARLIAAQLCNRFQVRALPLRVQRTGSRMKSLLSLVLRPLPDGIKNTLRRSESRWLAKRGPQQRTIESSVPANLSGLRVLIVDDAVDTGTSVRMARKWAGEMGADPEHIKVAALTITTEMAEKEADFHVFSELCRFPWSSDSREHDICHRQYLLTSIPSFELHESTSPVQNPHERLSLFDFDGTLCCLNSWHVFLRWLLQKRNRDSLRVGFALARRFAGISSPSDLKNTALSCMRGWTSSEVDALGARIYDKYLRPNLFARGLAELRLRQSEGYRVIVVSGAFDFLLRPFCAEYGVPECVCTRLAFEGDRCLGMLADKEVRGEYKRMSLERYLGNEKIAWDESRVYSDELNDLPIFQLVKNAFLVGAEAEKQRTLPPGISHGPW